MLGAPTIKLTPLPGWCSDQQNIWTRIILHHSSTKAQVAFTQCSYRSNKKAPAALGERTPIPTRPPTHQTQPQIAVLLDAKHASGTSFAPSLSSQFSHKKAQAAFPLSCYYDRNAQVAFNLRVLCINKPSQVSLQQAHCQVMG